MNTTIPKKRHYPADAIGDDEAKNDGLHYPSKRNKMTTSNHREHCDIRIDYRHTFADPFVVLILETRNVFISDSPVHAMDMEMVAAFSEACEQCLIPYVQRENILVIIFDNSVAAFSQKTSGIGAGLLRLLESNVSGLNYQYCKADVYRLPHITPNTVFGILTRIGLLSRPILTALLCWRLNPPILGHCFPVVSTKETCNTNMFVDAFRKILRIVHKMCKKPD